MKGKKVLQQSLKRKLGKTILRNGALYYTASHGIDPELIEQEKLLIPPDQLLKFLVTKVHMTIQHLSLDCM